MHCRGGANHTRRQGLQWLKPGRRWRTGSSPITGNGILAQPGGDHRNLAIGNGKHRDIGDG